MTKKIDRQPLLIRVKDGRYEFIGDPNSRYHAFLIGYVKTLGGISDRVPDGTYTLKMKRQGIKIMTELKPIEG